MTPTDLARLYLAALIIITALSVHSFYLWKANRMKHWKTVLIPVGENWEQPVISKQFHTYAESYTFATDWWKLTDYVWVIANSKTGDIFSGAAIEKVDI